MKLTIKDKLTLMSVIARVRSIEAYISKLESLGHDKELFTSMKNEIEGFFDVMEAMCEKYRLDCNKTTYLDMGEDPMELIRDSIDIMNDSDFPHKQSVILNLSYLLLSANLTFPRL